jgi:hypothetical protein
MDPKSDVNVALTGASTRRSFFLTSFSIKTYGYRSDFGTGIAIVAIRLLGLKISKRN